ncbi:MAG: MFS transporter [Gammaproteobacteria bacterium]
MIIYDDLKPNSKMTQSVSESDSLLPQEKQAIVALSSIMGVRMLGLFMVLPVLALQAESLRAATPTLIGLSIGAYGLTQAFLQLPYGILSDRFGRKPMIVMGLVFLVLGSVIAAHATSIYTLILGRALQGSGAIGATLMAFLSDLTRSQMRTRAMAFMGASIGLAFLFAFILGPLILSWSSLSALFYVTAALGVGAILLALKLPSVPVLRYWTSWQSRIKTIGKQPHLQGLFVSVLCLHALLAATFIVIPKRLNALTPINPAWVYGGALGFAFLLIYPFFRKMDKSANRNLLMALILTLSVCLVALMMQQSFIFFTLILSAFFAIFCLLEAWLPALTSQFSPEESRGTTLGIFSTCQFLGVFLGGALGGLILEQFDLVGLQVGCIVLSVAWLLFCMRFKFVQQ